MALEDGGQNKQRTERMKLQNITNQANSSGSRELYHMKAMGYTLVWAIQPEFAGLTIMLGTTP